MKKAEPDPNDFDEENVVSVKVKKVAAEREKEKKDIVPLLLPEQLISPRDQLISPREPLESARGLLDDGGKSQRELHAIPELVEPDYSPTNHEGLIALKERKAEPQIEVKVPEPVSVRSKSPLAEKKESLLRNTTVFPSILEGMEPTTVAPQKRVKIIDVYDLSAKVQVPPEQYEESERELALKKHFLIFQMKERKAKEKLAAGATATPEEEAEEKKEQTAEEEEIEEEAKEEDVKEREDDDEGSMGSTSTGAAMRSHYSIRAAIDEKYVPKSIKNMNYMTIFMFVLLLSLAIAYYILEILLYSSIQDNIKNVQYSEDRKSSLFDIDLNVKNLVLISEDNAATVESTSVLDMTTAEKAALQTQSQANLTLSAFSLKEAQTQLSLKTSGIGSSQLGKINPDNVKIVYQYTTSDMPSSYLYTIWQAMLEVVVTALKISNMTISDITNDDPSVYVINKNSLNSLLVSLNESTNELIDVIETSRSNNMTVYLIFLIVASVAAAVSTLVLIPIINTAKKAKEKVLSLFFLLDDLEVRRYQTKCDSFKRKYKLVYDIVQESGVEERKRRGRQAGGRGQSWGRRGRGGQRREEGGKEAAGKGSSRWVRKGTSLLGMMNW